MNELKPLQKSVCLFSVVVLSAYYYQSTFYHHLYVLLLICGIFNHGLEDSKKKMSNPIHAVDVSLAHFTFVYTLYEGYDSVLILISLTSIALLYLLEHIIIRYAERIHILIHIEIVTVMVLHLNHATINN